jgi:cytochrome c oxidase subunit II
VSPTDQAAVMRLDWIVFSAAGLFVALLVWSLILIPPILWRRKDDRVPPQVKQNTPLELAYTAIPVVVVALLFWLTMRVEGAVDHLTPRPYATVEVTGFRWGWRFDYPGTRVSIVGTPQNAAELVLPVDETTHVDLTSVDVNHAFWIPAFLFKRDAIPGVRNQFDLTPRQIGTFRGECGEFCGLNHALMTFSVRVVSDADYRRWLRTAGNGT